MENYHLNYKQITGEREKLSTSKVAANSPPVTYFNFQIITDRVAHGVLVHWMDQ